MRRIRFTMRGVAVLFIVWSLTMAIGAAAAQEIVEIDFDVDSRVFEGLPRERLLLDNEIQDVDIGRTCAIASLTDNNRSVHPGNDLIVTSGGSTVTLFNVERGPNVRTDGDGRITLGARVQITMRLGEEQLQSSGGYRVFAVCDTPPPTECLTEPEPAFTIGVTPEDQEVAAGGDASFEVTLTNSGGEPFTSVEVEPSVDTDVDANVDTCASVGPLAVGAQSSYSCTAEGVEADFTLILTGNAQGENPLCQAVGAATASVAVTSTSCANPALTVTVAPENQEVPVDGDATFQVTVKNTGDDDLVNVAVVSSVAACGKSVGNLAVGAEFSYSCTAAGVGGDLNVSFDASGEGVIDPEFCLASGSAGAIVGNPTTTTTTTTTKKPKTPIGVPTGIGVPGTSAVPIGALAVVALGITVLGVGTYRIARKER